MKVKLKIEAGTEAAMAVGLYHDRNMRSVKVIMVWDVVDATSGSAIFRICPELP